MQLPSARLRAMFGLDFERHERSVELAMLRVLAAGAVILALLGSIDSLWNNRPLGFLQPVGSVLIGLAAITMIKFRRPYPRSLLAFAAALSLAFIWSTAIATDVALLTNNSAMVIISVTGIGAEILGGVHRYRARIFWLVTIAFAVSIQQTTLGDGFTAVVADALTASTVMAMGLWTVAAIRDAADHNRARVQSLVDTAPLAMAKVDLSGSLRWLEERSVSTESLSEDLETGRIDDIALLDTISVTTLNADAIDALDALNKTDGKDALRDMLLASGARKWAMFVGRLALNPQPGSTLLEDPRNPNLTRYFVLRWSLQSNDLSDVVLAITEITVQKRAEAALAEQVRTKDRFIASLSHELRTPMTAVVGLLDELTDPDRPLDAADTEEMLHIVASQSRDVASMLEDLLVVGRASDGVLAVHTEAIDVVEAARQAIRSVEGTIDDALPAGLRSIADPIRVRQIIRNLVENAVRHGGPNRRIQGRSVGSSVVVLVIDDGSPIPEELSSLMFEPYERAHTVTGRTQSLGIGLSVGRTLAELMGGSLTYNHRNGENIFRLMLPSARALSHTAEPITSPPPAR